MAENGDSSILLHSNTGNLLRNNEICCLKPELLSQINLECSFKEELGPLPLMFSQKHGGLDIIRSDDGRRVSELTIRHVTYIKWFLPGKYLEDFKDFNDEEELGIITVDSQNILDFYPRKFKPIRLKGSVIGLFTSYFRDENSGILKLAVLAVESDGHITRWVPYDSDGSLNTNSLKRQVKSISETNVLLELNNLKSSVRGHSGDGRGCLGEFGGSECLEKYLNLNRKLFIVTFEGDLLILDSVKLSLIRVINVKGQISCLYPFVDSRLRESLAVTANSLTLIDLSSFESFYEYSNNMEEFTLDLNSLNVSQILSVSVAIHNPRVLVISSKYKRAYLFDILRNNLISFVNVSVNSIHLYYYLHHGNAALTNSGGVGDCRVRFGCVGVDGHSLVGFDLFRQELLYSKISLPNSIGVISNSQLQPNLLLFSSNNSLMQLDIHYPHKITGGGFNKKCISYINGITCKHLNGFRHDEVEKVLDSCDGNTLVTRILTNNIVGLKTYKSVIKSEITCISFHPRLPNLSAVGCRDGSLYLFFLEFENVDLFEFMFLKKFNFPVKTLLWHLIPGGLNEELNLKKKNFLQRIWKSIYSSKYASVLLIQLSSCHVINGFSDDKGLKLNSDSCLYYMKLTQNPQIYSLNLDSDSESNMTLFTVLILQYPPPVNSGSLESLSELDNSTPGNYDHFSLICDYVCLVYYSENWVMLKLVLMDLNLNVDVVKKFRIRVSGVVTNVILTSKQYNQYLLYNGNDSFDPYEISNSVSDRNNLGKNSGKKNLKCTNSLQQYLILSTNLGYLYVTTLVQIYNNSFRSHSQDDLLTLDEIFTCGRNITQLDYTILYPSSWAKVYNSDKGCLCNESCNFVVGVGLHDMIFLFFLDFNHDSDKFRLSLFYSKEINYTNFMFINEPFSHFKLLINHKNYFLQYNFNKVKSY